MKSFEEIQTEIQDRTGDDSSSTLTKIKRWINDTQRIVLSSQEWSFLEKINEIDTVNGQDTYELPNDLGRLMTLAIIDGDISYIPQQVDDPQFWEYLQGLDIGNSDVTEYFYSQGNDLLIWPPYDTAGNKIRYRYRQKAIDMTLDDYNTGTITSISNGATTVEGSSTSWTSRQPAVNQYIKIDEGDQHWYPVSSITDDDTLELEKPYQGSTISSASSSYTLAEMPVLPSEFHDILTLRPLALYYEMIEDQSRAERYWFQFDGGESAGLNTVTGGRLKQLTKFDSGTTSAKYLKNQRDVQPLTSEERTLAQGIDGENWI